MKTLLILSCLALCACASSQTPPQPSPHIQAVIREMEANYSDRTVEIHTLPYGAMIDLNGDVIGISPCTLELKRCHRDNWPVNGNVVQILRARFWDGTSQEQHFFTTTTPPKKVAFIHPHAHLYPNPQPLSLTHR